uniref:Sodium-independent sulfate anion transporter n=1 Tax=Cacopsylla melanoneura TaxID=428564 RepID=A0A8D8SWT0_9HEMI
MSDLIGSTILKMKEKNWRKHIRRRLPIIATLENYTGEKFVADGIAGVTVGLTVMPQALAYATLAGVEPQFGLYSSFTGCLIYAFLGSCKDITIGPTALMSLMTYQQVTGRNVDFGILLCFLSGIVQLLMGVFHLGVLIDFISIPVTVGFTSATSLIIAVSQLKGLLGLRFSSSGFLDCCRKVASHLHEARAADTILGVSCIVVLLLMRKLKDVNVSSSPVVKRSLWLLSTSRNALVVMCCSTVGYYLHSQGQTPFILTGEVRPGLPPFQLPPFSTTLNNQTLGFLDMCTELGSSIVMVPVIAVLGNVAIAKAFASGDSVDATQELLCLGVCNVFGAFVSSIPITGSFSRSAVNHASGVQTTLGGLFTGALMLLALSCLTPYFYFIPRSCLAAVIICAVIFLIEISVVRPMWRSSRSDLIPTGATFALCLILGVEFGILVGVAINIVLLLYPSARPSFHVDKLKTSFGQEYLQVTPGNSLYFPAVDFIRTNVGRAGVKQGSSQLPVVVDCRYILGADFTAAKGVSALILDFSKRGQGLFFYNPRPTVVSVLRGVCSDDFVYVSSETELYELIRNRAKYAELKSNDTTQSSKVIELTEVTTSCRMSPSHVKRRVFADVDEPLLGSHSATNEINRMIVNTC